MQREVRKRNPYGSQIFIVDKIITGHPTKDPIRKRKNETGGPKKEAKEIRFQIIAHHESIRGKEADDKVAEKMLIIEVSVEGVELWPAGEEFQLGREGKVPDRMSKIVYWENNGRKAIFHPKRRGRRDAVEGSRFGRGIILDTQVTGKSRERRTFGRRPARRG